FLINRARGRVLERKDTGFVEAYRDLELARGGPHRVDRLLRVQADFYATDLAMLEADEKLGPENTANTLAVLDAAEAKYAIARGYLQRLRVDLLATRRNVIWWLQYHRLLAQYMSERNLWLLARAYHLGTCSPSDPDRADRVQLHDTSRFLRRMRQGLLA